MPRSWPALLPLLALLAAPAPGEDPAALKPQGYVSDFARVLDRSARAALEDYCARVEQATGAQIALVTIHSLDGQPVEQFAEQLFRQWGIGSKSKNEGVLVLLAIQDRRSRVEVGYGLEPVIPDGFAGAVLRSMRDSLRAGDYASALQEAARTLGETVAREKKVEIGGAPLPRRRPARKDEDAVWGPLVTAVSLILFLIFIAEWRNRRGYGPHGPAVWTMGNPTGRWGGHGGGGFGGYDSWGGGGGFGGFGGGMSGGGGASGSW